MIRKLTKKYVDGIMTLHKDSIFPLWDKLNRSYSINGVEKFVKEVFDKGDVYGYFIQDRLRGVIGVEVINNRCEIAFLLVNPKEQGKGIGKKLMNFIETKFKDKVESFFLDVLTKNPAVNFYEKLGYRVKSKKGGKYVMEKQL